MKQVYVFARSQNEYFPDAVSVGDLFLAPILDSQIKAVLEHCANNDISHAELTADEIINDTETQVMITSYESAKIVCNHFKPIEEF